MERRVRVRRNRKALIARDLAPLTVDLVLDEAVMRRVWEAFTAGMVGGGFDRR
ncbi:hypothetical protein OG874_32505 [Nocardia sp. NBC_00565]|uniref:hypothetical protein n=1 Tax=Nocardia sp. NBC_00565 TaxID=2975993 RepID=UPI002E816392|nr:hypothetical protein [Nocardia sp. NBC_00565]WUC08138.1 hypothetical protein OG874_32505 [Nocardia sp. NBC_00565]